MGKRWDRLRPKAKTAVKVCAAIATVVGFAAAVLGVYSFFYGTPADSHQGWTQAKPLSTPLAASPVPNSYQAGWGPRRGNIHAGDPRPLRRTQLDH